MTEYNPYGCPSCTAVYFHGGGFDESTTECRVCGFDPEDSSFGWVNLPWGKRDDGSENEVEPDQ